MDNNPNNINPNNTPDDQMPDASSIPNFEQEPSTDPQAQPSVEPSTEVNTPMADSPFGPPIESLGTGPTFPSSMDTPSVPTISPVQSAVPPTPIADVTPTEPGMTPLETPQPVTPAPLEATPAVDVPTPLTQAETVAPMVPASVPKKKKKLLGLWIALAAVILLFAGAVVGYFVIKGNADTAAATYTANVKSYLDEVYDVTTSPAAGVTEVRDNFTDIQQPKLEDVFLGSISDKYVAAKELAANTSDKINDLTTKLGDFVAMYEFYNDWVNLQKEMVSTTAGVTQANAGTVLKSFQAKLDEAVTLAEEAVLPSELESKREALVKSCEELAAAWSDLVDAFDAKDSAAYSRANADFNAAGPAFTASLKPFSEYYNDLSSKTRDSAKEIKSFNETIKKD